MAAAAVVVITLALVLTEAEVGPTHSPGASPTQQAGAPSGPFGQNVVQVHLDHLDALSIAGVMPDYAPNATVTWAGDTQSFGGTYSGTPNINSLLSYFLTYTRQMTIVSGDFSQAAGTAAHLERANVSLSITGTNTVIGAFNGNVYARYWYGLEGGQWLIYNETWFFNIFNSQFTAGATTFPQWQLHGPPLTQRYSESPFKNWVYFYGGAAAVIGVASFMAAVPVITWARRRKRS